MPGLGFKARFADPVEFGDKVQTLRAYRADGRDPKVGDWLAMWTGLRSKNRRKLAEGICTRADPITVARSGIWIWGEHVNGVTWELHRNDGAALRIWGSGLDQFAGLDGFVTWDEMKRFLDKEHGLTFRGLLIQWRKTPRLEWRKKYCVHCLTALDGKQPERCKPSPCGMHEHGYTRG